MPDGESTLFLAVFPTQGCQAQTDTKTLLQSEEEAPRALSQGPLAQAPLSGGVLSQTHRGALFPLPRES